MTDGQVQAHKLIRNYWRSVEYIPPLGASRHDIELFEAAYGVELPSDFASFLIDIDASKSDSHKAFSRNTITFWSFERVHRNFAALYGRILHDNSNASAPRLHVSFADYLYSCWTYDICVAGGNIGEVSAEVLEQSYDGAWRSIILAKSFTDFVDLYVRGVLDEPSESLRWH